MHAYIIHSYSEIVEKRDMERTEAVTSSFIWRPNANATVEITPSCLRCGSSNTKFCYYNNYSLTQPRYFCKDCRRYWTKGESLRNVPVGVAAASPAAPNPPLVIILKLLTANSSSSGGSSPSIDLALVYANFLIPKPDESTLQQNCDLARVITTEFLVENPTGASIDPSWSVDINDAHHHHHHHHHHHYDHQVVHIVEECGYNGLPPFPGEELLSLDTNGVWSDALLIGHNHVDVGGVTPAQAVHEPVVHFADESNESTNLL